MAWTRVQNKNGSHNTTDDTLAVAFDSNITSGNLLIAAVLSANSGKTFTFSDSQSNTWTVVENGNVRAPSIALAYTIAGSTGANTVTATRTDDSDAFIMEILEYSEPAVSPLDQNSYSNGFSSSVTGVQITTTEDNELLINLFGGQAAASAANYTPDSGDWVQLRESDLTSRRFELFEQLDKATGTYNTNGTLPGNRNWNSIIASFKQAAGGGGGSSTDGFYYYRMMQG